MSLFHRRKAPLVRKRGTQRPAKFILAVEGEKTERVYFELFANERIKPTILPASDGCSSPAAVRDRLVAHCQESAGELIEGLDELWLVIDVDHHERHGHLRDVVDDMKLHGYRVAVSRPCFEVWLLLHLTDDVDALHSSRAARAAMGAERQRRGWRSHIDVSMLDGLSDAVERARLRSDPEADWPATVGSDVFLLIDQFAAAGVVKLVANQPAHAGTED